MKIGVLDLLSPKVSRNWRQMPYAYLLMKQYASIMPQIISCWCRELNHTVFYRTYFGQEDPKKLLPNDLDVVFISTYTQGSTLAYALAKLYRTGKTLTVIGGPHAKQFPADCLRFFDIVVRNCNKNLIADVLKDKPQGQIVNSTHTLQDIPSVQDRLPEIKMAHFWWNRPTLLTVVPILSSTGCPFNCDFCVEWNNPYNTLPLDQLKADLHFILNNLPNVLVSFSDPNLAVNLHKIMALFKTLPTPKHRWYLIECNLSALQERILEQLRDTGCLYVMPGIESFTAYSKKSGLASASARKNLDELVRKFKLIFHYIPGIHANFLFGLDTDEGDVLVELFKEFIDKVPFVMPNINIPTPFGGTPLYRRYFREGRILTSMPFTFYWTPYLVTIPQNYDPVAYYEKLIKILSYMTSIGTFFRRSYSTSNAILRFLYNPVRTVAMRQVLIESRYILKLLKTDRQFRSFHEGESQELPKFYKRKVGIWLGHYTKLLSSQDYIPLHK